MQFKKGKAPSKFRILRALVRHKRRHQQMREAQEITTMSTRHHYKVIALIEFDTLAETVQDAEESAEHFLRAFVDSAADNGKYIIVAVNYDMEKTDKENS